MSLNNIIKPQNPLVNSQGIPLSGGNVYLYEPGTTNFIPSFRDSELTVPHSNPVRLSGSGRANIWIDRDCDMFIFDRNGNQVTESLNANPDNLGSSESGGLAANGSFEIDSNADTIPDSWVLTSETGSSNGIDTTISTGGAQSFRFTSSGPGGGTLTTENFSPVNDVDDLSIAFDIFSTLASVRNIVRVEWYNISQVGISNTDVYDSVTNPVTFTKQEVTATPPATARFAKIKLIGIDPSVPLVGSTYFDGLSIFYPIASVSGAFGNLTIQNNEIISTSLNGDINLRPNGIGSVVIDYNGAQVASSVVDGFSARTDIVTATPPTTEAVTGKFSIFDLDATDVLAFVGFNGSNSVLFENLMHGGGIELAGENASGVRKTILIGDPDADMKMYQAGTEVVRTLPAANGGLEVNNTLTGVGFERSLTESDLDELALYKDTIAAMTADTTATLGDYYQCADYATGNEAGSLVFEAVAAATGTADGVSYIDHDTLSLQFKRIFNTNVDIKEGGAVGNDATDATTAIDNALVLGKEIRIGEGTFLATEIVTKRDDVKVTGPGTLKNTTIDEPNLYLGERQSGADAKHTYAQVTGVNFVNTSADTDDNWPALGSSMDWVSYLGNLVKDSYVGLSFNKNYNVTPAANGGVNFGTIVGNLIKTRFLGIEHLGTKHVATVGNAIEGTSRAGPGFRWTGDSDTPSVGNGSNTVTDSAQGVSVQTETRANNIVGYAVTDCINGVLNNENTTVGKETSRNNIIEATALDCDYGVFTYNTQYQWVRASISNAATKGFQETNTTGGSGIGDLKSNKFDFLIHDSQSGATIEGDHNEITINASDIVATGVVVNGDHNNVKVIIDLANTVGAANSSLKINGTHNLVEVISTGNATVGSTGDILVAGDKNSVRVMCDATVRISGDNNTIYGYANSTIDVGTGNDVTGVSAY